VNHTDQDKTVFALCLNAVQDFPKKN